MKNRITYLTTKAEFCAIQKDIFHTLHPGKRYTKKVEEYISGGHYIDQTHGTLFAWTIRDTFEKRSKDIDANSNELELNFTEFTQKYADCPKENRYNLFVGFLYWLKSREGNYYNGEYVFRSNYFFTKAMAYIELFDSNSRNYRPFIYTK